MKAARRALRAFGFRKEVAGPLTADQVAEYRMQFRSLVDIDLSLEKVRRELESRPSLFEQSESVRADIQTANKYLGALIEEWECKGSAIREKTAGSDVEALDKLQEFLGSPEGDYGIWKLSGPLRLLQEKIGPQL